MQYYTLPLICRAKVTFWGLQGIEETLEHFFLHPFSCLGWDSMTTSLVLLIASWYHYKFFSSLSRLFQNRLQPNFLSKKKKFTEIKNAECKNYLTLLTNPSVQLTLSNLLLLLWISQLLFPFTYALISSLLFVAFLRYKCTFPSLLSHYF